jgi:hypothetical protein
MQGNVLVRVGTKDVNGTKASCKVAPPFLPRAIRIMYSTRVHAKYSLDKMQARKRISLTRW